MRIALLTATFAPDEAPTSVIATRLAEALAARGHDIWVGAANPWYRPSADLPVPQNRNITIQRTPEVRGRLANYFQLHLQTLLWARELRSADVVLSMAPPLTLATAASIAALGRPTVHDLQDVFPEVLLRTGRVRNEFALAPLRFLERVTYAATTHLVTVSDSQRRFLLSSGVRGEKVTTIPNFADTDALRPQPLDVEFRMKFGIEEGQFVALFAGNFGIVNDHDVLVGAVRELAGEPVTFLLAGGGRHWTEAEKLARENHNVKIAGYRPAREMSRLYAAANVGLVTLRKGLSACSLPSKTYSIMAAGLPFVATVDEDSDIVHVARASGGGVALAPGDSHELAETILTLARDRDRAAAMGRAGHQYVTKHHTAAVTAIAFEALFKRLTDKP